MKIKSIFIVSHFKEFKSRRLQIFLKNLLETKLNNIKIFLFMSDNILQEKINEIKNIVKTLNLEIVLYDNTKSLTYTMFDNIFKFKISEYKEILILESDCVLLDKLFLDKINNDLQCYNNIWIYGSYYYGIAPWAQKWFKNKIHMNGVAVYNRTNEFISMINNLYKENKKNYDLIITNYLINNNIFLNKTVDSKLILNFSHPLDINISLNYKNYKENTCILHTKNQELLKNCLS